MSEERIRDLHLRLSEKLVEEAHATKKKAEPGVVVRLGQEIVDIRREIYKELQKLKGVSAGPKGVEDVE